MSKSICVNDFQWIPGKNDAEYIKLLKSSRDEWQKIAQKAIAKLKALSKAQEPRVMTLEEVLENAREIGFPCWVEDHIEDIVGAFLFPAVVTSDDTYVQYTGNAYYEGAIYHWAYNKRLRCWTSRPTDEQREAIPWE